MDSIENGYQLYFGHHMVDLLDNGNMLMVQDIWGYKMNDSFILAYRQVPERKNIFVTGDYDWYKKHPTDSMQYWIVPISIDSAFGPYTYNEYLNQRSILKVDRSLVLHIGVDTVSRY